MIKKAFTLAEVLIVIAVIGIVSTLTITNLSDSYKQDNTIVKLKKIRNELESAQKQAYLKYGDDYDSWYSSSMSSDAKKTEDINRILEFLDISQTGVTFPYNSYNGNSYTKVELKDGTILSLIIRNGVNHPEIYVATDGINGKTLGKNIFGFEMVMTDGGYVYPKGRGLDRKNNNDFKVIEEDVTGNNDYIYATNWAITNENLDYLKCPNVLNWETKTSCD